MLEIFFRSEFRVPLKNNLWIREKLNHIEFKIYSMNYLLFYYYLITTCLVKESFNETRHDFAKRKVYLMLLVLLLLTFT